MSSKYELFTTEEHIRFLVARDSRINELEAQKTPTPYSVADDHMMSAQCVRAEEALERVRGVITDWQNLGCDGDYGEGADDLIKRIKAAIKGEQS